MEPTPANRAAPGIPKVVESMLDPHVLLQAVRDQSGTIVDFEYAEANAAACDYLGMASEDLMGARLLDLLPGQSGSGMFDLYAQAVESGEPLALDDYAYPHEIIQEERRYDIRAVKVDDALSFTWRDVTERHRAREALAASENRYRLLAENASDVVVQSSTDGTIEWVSGSVVPLLGLQPADLIDRSILEYLHPADLAAVVAAQERLADDEPLRSEVRVRRVDGDYRWVALGVQLLLDESGLVIGQVSSLRDIHDQYRASEALAESEELFRTAMDHSAVGMCLVAPDGGFMRVNAALCRMLGRSPAELMAATWQELTHPDDIDKDQGLADEVLAGKRDTYRLRKRFLRPDGEVVWGDLSVACVRHPDGSVRHFISQIVDVTEMHRQSAQLAASEEKFRLLAENATDAVLHGRDGIMVWLSPSLTNVLGWAPDDWVGRRFEEFTHPDDVAIAQACRGDVESGNTLAMRLRLRDSSGDFHWAEVHASPFVGRDGVTDGVGASFRVIDEQVQAETILEDRARYDELTGVLNRTEMFERLRLLLGQQPRTGHDIAVAFCDVDDFKEINDTHGHQMGDHVLRTIADELRALLRQEDLIARIGGDEILLVLTGVHGLDGAVLLARKVLDRVSQPHSYRDIAYAPKLSIGLTLLHRDEQPDDVIARADRAMYAAKKAGGNRIVTA